MGVVKYSGPVASFHCPTEATIRSLKVHFSPKQLGEGTPSPENVREIEGWDGVVVYKTGKNLIDINSLTGTSSVWWNGSVLSGYADHCVTPKISVKPNTSYYLNRNSYNQNYVSEFDQNGNFLKQVVRGTSSIFTTDSDVYYIGITIGTDYKNTAQLVLGSTETSYEPYRGETVEYEFGVLGKNKFDYASTTFIQGIRGNDGDFVSDSVSHYTEQFIPVIPATQYTLSGNNLYSGGYVVRIYYSDANKNWISKTSGDRTNALTFTTPSNCYYIQIQTNSNGTNPDTWQLELGSTATAYEPYDPNKTVYGGWVDLISGEVQEEWSYTNFRWGDVSINNDLENYDGKRVVLPGSIIKTTTYNNKYCNVAPFDNAYGRDSLHFYTYVSDGDVSYARVYLPKNTDADTFVQLAVLLDDKITYQLNPIELQTFLGHNNVWSNADYVEVEYDLHETQNILARKQFIIASQPHIEKLAAAPLQSFKTDMAAPVKECKVHFEPIQDLNGYNKPWVGGAGKNLFNINAPEQDPSDTTAVNTTLRIFEPNTYCVGTSYSNYFYPTKINSYSVSNNTLTVNSDTGYAVGFAVKAAAETTYFISASITNDGRIGVAYYDSTGQWISGEVNKQNKSFTTPANTDIIVLCFNSPSNQTEVSYSNIQLEVGSAATAYEPYENICPISGWTNLEVTRCGKNLFNKNDVESGYISGVTTSTRQLGEIIPSNDWKTSNYILVAPSTTYTLSIPNQCNASVAGLVMYSDKEMGKEISGISIEKMKMYQDYYYTFTTPSNCYYIRFAMSKNYIDTAQFEVGSALTKYESYIGTTIPITFPSEAGTIYGGYVDLVTGNLVQEYGSQILNGTENWTRQSQNQSNPNSQYNPIYLTPTNPKTSMNDSLQKGITNYIPEYTTITDLRQDGILCCRFGWGDTSFYLCNVEQFITDIIDITTLKQYLSEHPLTIIYKLKEPIIHQLTPTQLKTLRGTNNIWASNNGANIELSYWKH